MVDIQVTNLTKFFVIGENLLENLTFEIQEGECVAILGRNGCGKTTLFNILTGQMDVDSGEVYVNPNDKLGLISQIPRFPKMCSVPPSRIFCGSARKWNCWNARWRTARRTPSCGNMMS